MKVFADVVLVCYVSLKRFVFRKLKILNNGPGGGRSAFFCQTKTCQETATTHGGLWDIHPVYDSHLLINNAIYLL